MTTRAASNECVWNLNSAIFCFPPCSHFSHSPLSLQSRTVHPPNWHAPHLPSVWRRKPSHSVFDILDIIAISVHTTFSYSTAGQAPVESPGGFGRGLSNSSTSVVTLIWMHVLSLAGVGNEELKEDEIELQ